MIQPSLSEIQNGVYTATVTAVSNCTVTASTNCQYMKVGNMVTVVGRFFLQATVANTFTEANITLPTIGDLTSPEQCAGVGVFVSGTTMVASIRGNNTTDKADIYVRPSDTANNVYYFNFSYRVQ